MSFRSARRYLARGVLALALIALALVAAVDRSPVLAQTLTPELLRALQDRATNPDGTDGTTPANKPPLQTYKPVDPSVPVASLSRLEQLYTARAGRPLLQFGYDFLGSPAAVSVVQSGAIQDSYILGNGDELVVVFRGQENSSYRQRIGSDGRVILPKLNPIQAAGRTFGDFRRELQQQVAQAFISTSVFVSLGEVHQLSVLVSGEVRTPGMRIVSALASPLDAILLSGGISKTGSLRAIKLIRDGTVRTIDLYGIIAQGTGGLPALRDGDRIFVPVLGPTVAIAGVVRRPGIFELPIGTLGIGASSLIKLAGGTEIAASYNVSKIALDHDGSARLVPFSASGIVRSGEVIFVDIGTNATYDSVQLAGAVTLPGNRPLSSGRTVGELIHSPGDLTPEAYTPFALVLRRDSKSNALQLLPFSLVRAMHGTAGVALQSNDIVYVFTYSQIRAMAAVATTDMNMPYQPQPLQTGPGGQPGGQAPATDALPRPGAEPGAQPPDALPPGVRSTATTAPDDNTRGATRLDALGGSQGVELDPRTRLGGNLDNTVTGAALQQAAALGRTETGAATRYNLTQSNEYILQRLATDMVVPPEELKRTVADSLVWVLDSVRLPGPYAAASGTTLAEMIDAAGGPLRVADLSGVEVTSSQIDQLRGTATTVRQTYSATSTPLETVMVDPRTVIRLRPVYTDQDTGTITIAGQVRFPGVFDITRNERLSAVLQRAGGLTDVAYPYGAVFTRKSAAFNEKEGNARVAREVESQIAVASAGGGGSEGAPPASQVAYLQQLVQSIRETPALGRVMVTADPTILAISPDRDPLLEPGDTIYIPKRPSSVTVSGDVLNPGSFQYRAGMSIDDYITLAGGATQTADDGRAFVILPDGSAASIHANWLSFNRQSIPPGSTVVVPRDLRPFDWFIFLKDVTQIASQLAITAASLSILHTNN